MSLLLITGVSSIILVGVVTYGILHFYPLHTHRTVMIKKVEVLIGDIVNDTIEQNDRCRLSWPGIVQAIRQLNDIRSDIAIDQLIAELEVRVLYPSKPTNTCDRCMWLVYTRIRHRLKLALTKDPNLATVTIPKRYIVRWIQKSIGVGP